MKRRILIVGTVALLATLISAPLSIAAKTASPTPVTSNPYGAGAAVDPAGPNDPILTLENGSKKKGLTYGALLAMHPSTLTIYEPFVKKVQTFTVIPLADLFKLVGIKGSDTVVTSALNDYVYTNTASKFLGAKGYLAIKRAGTSIPYDQGGPIRIIFPNNSSWAKFLDPWNWSLSKISVKP